MFFVYLGYKITHLKSYNMNELNYLGITIKVKDGEYSVWENSDGKPVVRINRILASKFIMGV